MPEKNDNLAVQYEDVRALGDQPNLRDPLENKYFSIKKSKFTGEGAFATRDLPANTIYANYGGFLHTKYEENSKIA